MQYSVKDHNLVRDGRPVSFEKTPHQSPQFTPAGVVLHDTAGHLKPGSTTKWFQNPDARASAHFVVERDGTIVQMAKLNCRCWHAGQSTYKGKDNVNGFAFGIEIVNMGKLDKVGDGVFRTWFKKDFHHGQDGLTFQQNSTSSHGTGWWHVYSEEQIDAVIGICRALRAGYGIKWITTHWYISPGRKVDPNPLFPLDAVQAAVFGQDGNPAAGPDDGLQTVAAVNQRRWPSFADNVIQVIPRGEAVDVIRQGTFANGNQESTWYLVSYKGNEGWVHGDYLS